MKKINLIFLFFLTGLITACGFHLRGSQDLSVVLPEVQLSGVNPHGETGRELVRGLTASKVKVVSESATVLTISQDNISKRVLSVDSAGRANQYELIYQLDFSLVKKVQDEDAQPQIQELIKAQTIREKREYLFDANLVLAKTREEQKLNSDMRQSAILQLLRRINFSLKSATKKGVDTK